MNPSVAANRLERAVLKKFGTPRNMLAALGFDTATINGIIEQEDNMKRSSSDRRRYGRDDEPMDAEMAMEAIEDVFEECSEPDKLVEALRQRLAGGGEDRRTRRIGRDMPPVDPKDIRHSVATAGPLVSLPPDRTPEEEIGGQDRKRARDGRRHAMDRAPGLPSFAELFPYAQRG
jgi:hypothetical protein